MKRTTFKSSTKVAAIASSSIITALFMGQTALAGPDKSPAVAEETKVETIIIEEAEKTDATAMPNAAIEGDVELAPAETIESDYSVIDDADEKAADPAEEALTEDAETIVIESPETVIIDSSDAEADDMETDGETPEK